MFTSPASVDGVLAAETLGDWFSERYGLFAEPARFRIKDARVVEVSMPARPDIEAEIRAYLATESCSNRVGEFAIGTNIGLDSVVGNFLQDEKLPGVHIAFGDPYAGETGADWQCSTHVDALSTHTDVEVDGRPIMAGGRFLV